MKFKKAFVPIAVALLNIYAVVSWILVADQWPTQALRVRAYLKYWLVFDSVDSLNLFLVIITLGSLIYINYKPLSSALIRLSCSTIHILFLLLTGFSYL